MTSSSSTDEGTPNRDVSRESTVETPSSEPPPVNVFVGAGSDPLALGAAVFAIGALTLGMLFIGVFPAGAAGVAVPVVLLTSGLGLVLTTIWGIFLGSTLLAGIFGLVAGLFLSYGFMVLGITNNWYGIPSGDAAMAQAVFFIAFGCYFVFLVIPTLPFPKIYPALVSLVVVGLALSASAEFTADTRLAQAAGAVFLLITLGLFAIWLNVNMTAMGMKPFPSLGKPLVNSPSS